MSIPTPPLRFQTLFSLPPQLRRYFSCLEETGEKKQFWKSTGQSTSNIFLSCPRTFSVFSLEGLELAVFVFRYSSANSPDLPAQLGNVHKKKTRISMLISQVYYPHRYQSAE